MAQPPLILAVVGSVGKATAGVVGAARAASDAQEAAKLDAQQVRSDVEREAVVKQQEIDRLRGVQIVRAEAGGVSSGVGSMADLERETLGEGRKEIEDMFLSARRKVRAINLQAENRVGAARAGAASSLFEGLGSLGSIATQHIKGKSTAKD